MSIVGQKDFRLFWRFPGLLLYITSRGGLGRVGMWGTGREVLCARKNTQLTRGYLNNYYVKNTEVGEV